MIYPHKTCSHFPSVCLPKRKMEAALEHKVDVQQRGRNAGVTRSGSQGRQTNGIETQWRGGGGHHKNHVNTREVSQDESPKSHPTTVPTDTGG